MKRKESLNYTAKEEIFMNLLQLKYFQEVAKYQNITRTAEILHVSQPSLSTAIRHLEEELGIELFDRKGKSIVLNENGQNFLRDINSMFELLNRNQQNRNRLASGKTQKIYIGGEKSELKLSAFIARFLDRYPDVLISFKNAVSMTSLNPEILDFFILAEEPGSHPGPRLILDHEKHCILMSSHHPLAECSSVTLDMLKDETFVFVTPNANILPPGYRICEKAGFSPKVACVTNERAVLLAILRESPFVSVVPECDAITFTRIGEYRAFTLSSTHQRDIVLTIPSSKTLSEISKVFLSELLDTEEIQELNPNFSMEQFLLSRG